jgi:hypothetical protein
MRQSFLGGYNPYHLYYWELADDHQLLASALQRIDNSAAAPDANSVGTVSTASVLNTPVRAAGGCAASGSGIATYGGGSASRGGRPASHVRETARSHGRQRKYDELSDDGHEDGIHRLADSVAAMVDDAAAGRLHSDRAHIRQRYEKLEDQQRQYRHLFHKEGDAFFQEEVARLEGEIMALKQEYSDKAPK